MVGGLNCRSVAGNKGWQGNCHPNDKAEGTVPIFAVRGTLPSGSG